MFRKLSVAAPLLILVFFSTAYAEDSDLSNIFLKNHLTGTMVISSLDGTQTYIHDDKHAHEAVLPASTFKIPNTLIALETGAASDGKEIIKWDGKDKGMPAWNQDQSIETAFPVSCVWFYQELAKRIGKDAYQLYLKKMHYGNEMTGKDVSTFWLDGDLRISAVEQVEFLKKVYLKSFDFKPTLYELLSRIMIIQKTPDYTIRAKTGWAPKASSPVGWLVGYVESGGKVWFFATDLEISKSEDLHYRQEVTMDALKIKGII